MAWRSPGHEFGLELLQDGPQADGRRARGYAPKERTRQSLDTWKSYWAVIIL